MDVRDLDQILETEPLDVLVLNLQPHFHLLTDYLSDHGFRVRSIYPPPKLNFRTNKRGSRVLIGADDEETRKKARSIAIDNDSINGAVKAGYFGAVSKFSDYRLVMYNPKDAINPDEIDLSSRYYRAHKIIGHNALDFMDDLADEPDSEEILLAYRSLALIIGNNTFTASDDLQVILRIMLHSIHSSISARSSTPLLDELEFRISRTYSLIFEGDIAETPPESSGLTIEKFTITEERYDILSNPGDYGGLELNQLMDDSDQISRLKYTRVGPPLNPFVIYVN